MNEASASVIIIDCFWMEVSSEHLKIVVRASNVAVFRANCNSERDADARETKHVRMVAGSQVFTYLGTGGLLL